MESFSIWIKEKEDDSNINKDDSKEKENIAKEESCYADLHINLWDLKKEDPFIDFGIRLYNHKSLKELIIVIPFETKNEEVIDLIGILKNKNDASLIFNETCTVNGISKGEDIAYDTIKIGTTSTETILLPLKTQQLVNKAINIDGSALHGHTAISVDFTKLPSVYKKHPELYMRFRVKSEKIKRDLFCKVKRKNNYLESAFVRTQIIDLKINERRNMHENLSYTMTHDKHFQLIKFSSLHFFIMEPAEAEVAYGDQDAECRRLENDWAKYIGNGGTDKKGLEVDILAYHWKRKAGADHFEKYSKLVKVTSSESTIKSILMYLLFAILISVFASIIYEGIRLFITPTSSLACKQSLNVIFRLITIFTKQAYL